MFIDSYHSRYLQSCTPMRAHVGSSVISQRVVFKRQLMVTFCFLFITLWHVTILYCVVFFTGIVRTRPRSTMLSVNRAKGNERWVNIMTIMASSILIRLPIDLTEEEWQTYLSTIVEATRRIDPESGLTIWEAGVRRHSQFSAQNHGSAAFLYFHRYLLTWMERKLQTINPNFSFFYW